MECAAFASPNVTDLEVSFPDTPLVRERLAQSFPNACTIFLPLTYDVS